MVIIKEMRRRACSALDISKTRAAEPLLSFIRSEILRHYFNKKSLVKEITENEIHGFEFNRCDVESDLLLLKGKSSVDPDGIASLVLKNCAEALSYPLYLVLRQSYHIFCSWINRKYLK